MDDRIRRRIELPAPAERVWEALLRPSGWFGAEALDELTEGGRARFRFPDGSEREIVVDGWDPHRRLSFRWMPFEIDSSGRHRTRTPSRVSIELEPSDGGTILHLEEVSSSARVSA